MSKILAKLRRFPLDEPVLTGTIAGVAAELVANGWTWRQLIIAIVGVLLRQRVSPATKDA